jgi:hypothetical protein
VRAGLLTVLVCAGCGNPPCTHCPAIGGSYTVSYGALDTNPCPAPSLLPAVPTLIIGQHDADLTSSALKLELHGTVSDDGQFTLGGESDDLAGVQVRFEGVFTAPNILDGHFSESETIANGGNPRYLDAKGNGGCAIDTTFNGVRDP